MKLKFNNLCREQDVKYSCNPTSRCTRQTVMFYVPNNWFCPKKFSIYRIFGKYMYILWCFLTVTRRSSKAKLRPTGACTLNTQLGLPWFCGCECRNSIQSEVLKVKINYVYTAVAIPQNRWGRFTVYSPADLFNQISTCIGSTQPRCN